MDETGWLDIQTIICDISNVEYCESQYVTQFWKITHMDAFDT